MAEGKLLISVIIPVYNRKEFLREALLPLSEQTLKKDLFEVIVVDDGSNDGTRNMLEELKDTLSYSFKILEQKHEGPAAARNLGAENAQAPILAFLDSDMKVDSGWLDNALAHFKDPSVLAVEAKTESPGQKRIFSHWVSNESGGMYQSCNMFYRRNIFKELGGFDQKFKFPFGEDYDLALRVLAKGRIVFAQDAIAYHPVLQEKAGDILRKASFSKDIPYLYKRHREKMRPFLGFRIERIFTGIFFGVFILALFALNTPGALAGLGGAILTTFFLERERFKRARPLEIIWGVFIYTLSNALTFFMFLYGCAKYRVMPSIGMLRRY